MNWLRPDQIYNLISTLHAAFDLLEAPVKQLAVLSYNKVKVMLDLTIYPYRIISSYAFTLRNFFIPMSLSLPEGRQNQHLHEPIRSALPCVN